ncbi:hypothetical protein SLEP1_g43193 [Rubroshorea leprosula]|uniref:Uncharacterized protein n=1 Tax=Rubroshorea leprosula TaxID=152421 RepID=A0AAV5LC66_9ROSI|nr:hypothetical protein SLEP1_g43193 [Rubroshorea leprosula]
MHRPLKHQNPNILTPTCRRCTYMHLPTENFHFLQALERPKKSEPILQQLIDTNHAIHAG